MSIVGQKEILTQMQMIRCFQNQLDHDYASCTPIQIRIYDDRILIWNSGTLPDNWTVERLKTNHPSSAVQSRRRQRILPCRQDRGLGKRNRADVFRLYGGQRPRTDLPTRDDRLVGRVAVFACAGRCRRFYPKNYRKNCPKTDRDYPKKHPENLDGRASYR